MLLIEGNDTSCCPSNKASQVTGTRELVVGVEVAGSVAVVAVDGAQALKIYRVLYSGVKEM